MDDAALAALEQLNNLAALGAVARAQPGGETGTIGGVVYVASGLPIGLFNQVQIVVADADPDDVARAVGRLRARGDRLLVYLRVGPDDHLQAAASDLGLVAATDERPLPGMALAPITEISPPPTEHDIRRVRDAEGLADFIALSAEGFGIPADLAERIVGPAMLRDAAASPYVGYREGRPVAISLGYRNGPTIGVYSVSVLDSERRRGFGSAMTRQAIADGAAAGCTVATLQSSEMGESIYRAMGFRTVARYRGFAEPPR
ncbi:MAG TPA: GNAT family N-acetyltransferase [Candidatus Limnocylindrales bacterium]|nr:GNAT family N-acetyltransferase [Candidatus Limnocylindrales bacterium]